MRSQNRKERGFTLIELLVVIAIIALLAAILFPVFAKAQNKARQTQCLSNIRNLTLSMLMFTQDNQNKYPTLTNPTAVGGNIDFTGTWASQISSYAGNNKIFTCPMDTNGPGFVSYGFDGQLVDPAGNGIATSSVTNPAEVGMFVDATSYKYPEAGVLNWGGDMHGTSNTPTAFVPRHSYNLTYADGHAASIGGTNNQNSDFYTSPIHQAFYGEYGFGWITNPGAGTVMPTSSTTTTRSTFDGSFNANTDTGTFTIGGSACNKPLWDAAIAGWVAAGGTAPTESLTGPYNYNTDDVDGTVRNYVSTNLSTAGIAKEPLGIIVSSSSRLNLKSISLKQIGDIFYLVNNDGIAGGNNLNVYQTCTASYSSPVIYQTASGPVTCYGCEIGTVSWIVEDNCPQYYNYGGFVDGVGDGTIPSTYPVPGFNLTPEIDFPSVLNAVANDPYGIGICPCGICDPTRVTILPLNLTGSSGITGTVIQQYSRAALENSPAVVEQVGADYTFGGGVQAIGANQWAFTRDVCAFYNPGMGGDPDAAQEFLSYVHSAQFQNSVIFKSQYFKP